MACYAPDINRQRIKVRRNAQCVDEDCGWGYWIHRKEGADTLARAALAHVRETGHDVVIHSSTAVRLSKASAGSLGRRLPDNLGFQR